MELIKKYDIKVEQIERIGVRICSYFMQLVVLNEKGEVKYAPRTLNEALFSLPFTVATAILKGSIFPDVLTEETLRDTEILNLSRKITVEATPEKDEIFKKEGFPPNDVDIYTTDGKVYSGCEPFVKGHPQNPMTFAECAEKFQRCVKFSAKPLPEQRLDEFIKQAERLEEIDDVRGIIGNLS